MSKLTLAPGLLLLLASVAGAAHAQRFVPAAPVVASFGQCIIERAPERSRALMATPVQSREEDRLVRDIVRSGGPCIGRQRTLTTRTGEVRGTIAEALLRAHPTALTALRTTPPQASVPPPASEGRAFVLAYARCLVDAESAKAAWLIETAHGSPDERAAMLAFGPVMAACMPEGQAYRLDIFDVRNHMAVRLYELALQVTQEGAPDA